MSIEKHIADAEDNFHVINITPDFCQVGNCVVPFNIARKLENEDAGYAQSVFARSTKVLTIESIIGGVNGNAGAGVLSGVSGNGGASMVVQGASTVFVENRMTARHDDLVLMSGAPGQPPDAFVGNCVGQVCSTSMPYNGTTFSEQAPVEGQHPNIANLSEEALNRLLTGQSNSDAGVYPNVGASAIDAMRVPSTARSAPENGDSPRPPNISIQPTQATTASPSQMAAKGQPSMATIQKAMADYAKGTVPGQKIAASLMNNGNDNLPPPTYWEVLKCMVSPNRQACADRDPLTVASYNLAGDLTKSGVAVAAAPQVLGEAGLVAKGVVGFVGEGVTFASNAYRFGVWSAMMSSPGFVTATGILTADGIVISQTGLPSPLSWEYSFALERLQNLGATKGVVVTKVPNRVGFTGAGETIINDPAELAYASIRSVGMSDIPAIAENTGLSSLEAAALKKHLFFGKHAIPEGGTGTFSLMRFSADDEIAFAWQQAQRGPLSSEGRAWFRQLADHELGERVLMARGVPYRNPAAWDPKALGGAGRFNSTPPGAHDLAPPQPGWGTFPNYCGW